MITEYDLDEAIMECQGKRNPDANTCMKLAAFYTIKQHLYPKNDKPVESVLPANDAGYSYSSGGGIAYSGESEFAGAVHGKDPFEVFPVIDELMETIKVINPRLYEGVIRRLQ